MVTRFEFNVVAKPIGRVVGVFESVSVAVEPRDGLANDRRVLDLGVQVLCSSLRTVASYTVFFRSSNRTRTHPLGGQHPAWRKFRGLGSRIFSELDQPRVSSRRCSLVDDGLRFRSTRRSFQSGFPGTCTRVRGIAFSKWFPTERSSCSDSE